MRLYSLCATIYLFFCLTAILEQASDAAPLKSELTSINYFMHHLNPPVLLAEVKQCWARANTWMGDLQGRGEQLANLLQQLFCEHFSAVQ